MSTQDDVTPSISGRVDSIVGATPPPLTSSGRTDVDGIHGATPPTSSGSPSVIQMAQPTQGTEAESISPATETSQAKPVKVTVVQTTTAELKKSSLRKISKEISETPQVKVAKRVKVPKQVQFLNPPSPDSSSTTGSLIQCCCYNNFQLILSVIFFVIVLLIAVALVVYFILNNHEVIAVLAGLFFLAAVGLLAWVLKEIHYCRHKKALRMQQRQAVKTDESTSAGSEMVTVTAESSSVVSFESTSAALFPVEVEKEPSGQSAEVEPELTDGTKGEMAASEQCRYPKGKIYPNYLETDL